MISEVDADGNGTVDFDEFRTMLTKRMLENETLEIAKQAYKVSSLLVVVVVVVVVFVLAYKVRFFYLLNV